MTQRRNLPPPSVELPLAGLLTEPDPSAANRMAAFDALPAPIRRFLDDCPFDFQSLKARDVVAREGTGACMAALRGSVGPERRRWVRDRDAALAWARDAFRVGPRPRHEPPPEGWSVHNFPG